MPVALPHGPVSVIGFVRDGFLADYDINEPLDAFEGHVVRVHIEAIDRSPGAPGEFADAYAHAAMALCGILAAEDAEQLLLELAHEGMAPPSESLRAALNRFFRAIDAVTPPEPEPPQPEPVEPNPQPH